MLVDADVPAGGIYRASDIAEDAHYRERESLVDMEDPEQGTIPMPGVVPKLSASPGRITSTGPSLGQHNEEIYGELLGKSTDEIDRLRKDGII